MEVCEVTERGFLIAMGYTGRKGNSKKLLEKASILEAVGSVGSSSMWNMGIRLCDCIPGKITAWSHPGFAEGQGLEVESQQRDGLGMTYVRLLHV